MLKTRIKASQISNLTDARYFAAWHVEWLGFDLDLASPNYCSPTQVQAIKGWVEGPKMIGEFGLQSPEDILTAVDLLDLDGVQIAPFSSASEIKAKVEVPIIKRLVPDSGEEVQELYDQIKVDAPHVEAFLLNLDKAGISWSMIKTGQSIPLSSLASWCQEFPIILSLNFQAEEVDEILEQVRPYGLNLIGGEEEKVGFKSFDDLDEVFELLEELE